MAQVDGPGSCLEVLPLSLQRPDLKLELRAPRFEFKGISRFCLDLSRPCDLEICR